MPLFDAIGKRQSLTLLELERFGNNAFTQLPPLTQRSAETLAAELVSRGAFGPVEQRTLSLQIQGRFPQADQERVLAAVRFLALRNTAGGSVFQLGQQAGGLTQFQKQLIGGALNF